MKCSSMLYFIWVCTVCQRTRLGVFRKQRVRCVHVIPIRCMLTHMSYFFRLFKTSTYLKEMFSQFKGIETEDELRNNEVLEHHATFVMSTLDEAITNIDNYDFVQQTLHRAGSSHRRFVGFEPSNFWVSITELHNLHRRSSITQVRTFVIKLYTSRNIAFCGVIVSLAMSDFT